MKKVNIKYVLFNHKTAYIALFFALFFSLVYPYIEKLLSGYLEWRSDDNLAKFTAQMAFLILGIISSIAGTLILDFFARNYRRNEEERLWNLSMPEKSYIVMSSFMMQTHKDKKNPSKVIPARPVVGLGQIQALPEVIKSLQAAYGSRFSWKNIYHVNDPALSHHTKCDVSDYILIGGNLTNAFTRNLSKILSNTFGTIIVNNKGVIVKLLTHKTPVLYKAEGDFKSPEKMERKDVAVIINCHVEGKHWVVLAGGSTYGTGAVSHYFLTRFRETKEWKAHSEDDYVAVVYCYFPETPNTCEKCELAVFYVIRNDEVTILQPKT